MTTEEQALQRYRVAEASAEATWAVSLSKYLGVAITDVVGHVVSDPAPAFRLTQIILADGSTLFVEGEHDHPYIVGGSLLLDSDVLMSIDEVVNE